MKKAKKAAKKVAKKAKKAKAAARKGAAKKGPAKKGAAKKKAAKTSGAGCCTIVYDDRPSEQVEGVSRDQCTRLGRSRGGVGTWNPGSCA